MSKARELKSLVQHPGWAHVEDYVLNSQGMAFNEISAKGTSSEDVLKGVGSIHALRKFMGWVQASSQVQDSEE